MYLRLRKLLVLLFMHDGSLSTCVFWHEKQTLHSSVLMKEIQGTVRGNIEQKEKDKNDFLKINTTLVKNYSGYLQPEC